MLLQGFRPQYARAKDDWKMVFGNMTNIEAAAEVQRNWT